MAQQQVPDWSYLYRDIRQQLLSALATLKKLHDKSELVRNKLLFHVDQGQGLTQEQLLEVYVQIEKLFPRRVRKTSDSLDDHSRST